jgi:hypothetical protein
MGTVIVIVCLVAALDLALFVTLYRRLDALPARVLALAKAERAEGEARALNSLGEAASAKVATITLSQKHLSCAARSGATGPRNPSSEAAARATAMRHRLRAGLPRGWTSCATGPTLSRSPRRAFLRP